MNDTENKKIVKALLKKALGYSIDEVSEEFSVSEDGKLVLQKRKIVNKHIPADMTAVKLLLDVFDKQENEDYSTYTDEELLLEKDKLLREINLLNEKICNCD